MWLIFNITIKLFLIILFSWNQRNFYKQIKLHNKTQTKLIIKLFLSKITHTLFHYNHLYEDH